MPSKYIAAIPINDPGTAYSTTAMSVAFWPGTRSADERTL
jgi:hypothetical protein